MPFQYSYHQNQNHKSTDELLQDLKHFASSLRETSVREEDINYMPRLSSALQTKTGASAT